MTGIRAKIQQLFFLLGQAMERWNWVVVVLCLALMGLMAAQLGRIHMDTSVEGYLGADDPHLRDYLDFRRQFGSDDLIVLGLQASEADPEVFTPGFLKRLGALHRDLAQQVPHLGGIASLHNAVGMARRGEAVGLERYQPGPGRDSLAEMRRRAMADPMVAGRLVSADGKMAFIIMRIDNLADAGPNSLAQALGGFDRAGASQPAPKAALTNQQNDEVVAAVRAVEARHADPAWTMHLSGTPILKQFLRRAMTRDAALFIQISLAVICLLLWLIFRRLSGVLLPMLVVCGAVLVTVGVMVLLDRPFKAPTIILPSFLMAMGVGASVHLLSVYHRNLREGLEPSPALCGALAHSGLPILLTSLTTACGLASFAGAEVAPVADLGLFGALGVMVAFVFTVTLLPALLSLAPGRRPAGFTPRTYAAQDRVLTALAGFSQRRRWWVAAAGLVLLVVAFSGLGRVKFSHNPLAWLPEDLEMRRATELMDRQLGGVVSVEVIIDSGKPGGALDPDLLRRVLALGRDLEGFSAQGVKVAKVLSLADLVSGLNRALTPGGPRAAAGAIPLDAKLVAQQLLIYENAAPRALAELTTSDYRRLRVSLLAPWVDAVAYGPFLAALQARLNRALAGRAQVTVTGLIPLMARTLGAAMHSAAVSYIWAGAVITFIMFLVSTRLSLGLISLAPNLLPILLALGLMGWLGIRLDLYTMLSGSIALGLVVDDTIHFMHNFRRYYGQGLTVAEAVRTTMLTTGRAMLITTVVLACGALVCVFSSLSSLFNFGLVAGSTIVLALAADFLLFPALLAIGLKPHSPRESATQP